MWAVRGGYRDVMELLINRGANINLVDRFGMNILHSACLGGDVEVLKHVLSQNILDINGRVWCGRTAVMLAAENGHKDVVELLVDKGADVSIVDETGDNILHCACRGGDVEVVKYILSQEMVDINSLGHRKKTPAMVAGQEGHMKVVELLAKLRADLSLSDVSGSNILHIACYCGQINIVNYILSLKLVDVNSRGWKNRTSVMVAAKHGHKEVVELLAIHRADLSLNDESGSNILHIACYRGHIGIVKYILSLNSVDVNSRGWKDRTPVMVAAEQRHKEVVKLLVQHGTDLSLRDKLGNVVQTACYRRQIDVVKYVLSLNSVDIKNRGWKKRIPVTIATELRNEEVVELLVKNEIDLSLTDEDGHTILHLVSYKGCVDVLKYLLSLNSLDINNRGWNKMTPVMLAADHGHKEVIELLLNHRADLSISDKAGNNILHIACDSGHIDVVQYLLSLKLLGINSRGWNKRTPVMFAAEEGHKEVIELLINHRADLSIIDKGGNNILHIACKNGHIDVVQYLFSLNSLDINSRGRKKRTPVMFAAEEGYKKVIELLINHRADLSIIDNVGNNILHIACQSGHIDVVQYLLSLNSLDINSRGRKKRTPVMLAADHGHKEVIELLINHRADLSISGKGGDNILHIACQSGHIDVVQYLLSLNSIDINSRGWKKRTPVMSAAKGGHKEVIELLINHRADLSISGKGGDNILHIACQSGHIDVVQYLLSLNSLDINSRGRKKRTPVMFAAKRGNRDVVELLVENEANLTLTDEDGKNFLDLVHQG
ncbi:serine/threonine-protein phosphatase 6 regulatory ankyrin repeat subunit B-like [Haliotis asinina]|uniref:serine/threonine-protein phosphatase 6 regulatory ankyrin repeat subunit B-like n=1 Tax=Haliotis asinina TaxID=109174 RepID=UPI00353254AA